MTLTTISHGSWRRWPLDKKRKLQEALRAELAVREAARQREPAPYAEWLQGAVPRGWDARAPHLRLISEHLDAVTRGEVDRLAIFMPPRHAKTETVTVRYPLYRLEQDPTCSVLVTGYSQRIANRFSRKTRNLAAGRVVIAQDKAASDEWHTDKGGQMLARGVGSPPTGVGFGLIVIDDPIKSREDAESQAKRERAWDWYTDDLLTRCEPGGAIVMVLTRWHEDDVASRALASEPGEWTVLKLPALAEADDPMGRPEGAALWPARFDVEALQRTRDVMAQNDGLRGWEALYQQNPQPREGTMFRVSAIEIVPARPVCKRVVRRWDLASSDQRGDYTVGVLMGMQADGRFVVLDVVRGQWGTDQRDQVIRQTAALDGRSVTVEVPQDPGSAGVDVAKHLTRQLAGFRVKAARETGDKATRADPFASQVGAGNVLMVKADWNAEYLAELKGFPQRRHDDQVDASSGAFRMLTERRAVRVV